MELPGLSAFALMDRLTKPTSLREAMITYFRKNGCPIDQLDKSIGTRVLYHQLAVATGVNSFFQGTPTSNNSNFSNNQFQLPQNEHFIITAIRLLTGNNASIQATDWTYGAGLAVVKNGSFNLAANGVTYLKNMPGTRADEDVTDNSQGFIGLDQPIVWPAQTDLSVPFTLLSAPAASDNLRIELHGVGFLS